MYQDPAGDSASSCELPHRSSSSPNLNQSNSFAISTHRANQLGDLSKSGRALSEASSSNVTLLVSKRFTIDCNVLDSPSGARNRTSVIDIQIKFRNSSRVSIKAAFKVEVLSSSVPRPTISQISWY